MKRVLVASVKDIEPALVKTTDPAESEKLRLVPTVSPPEKVLAVEVVAPLPVTVARVSEVELLELEELEVEEIVIVEPEVDIEVPPDPFIVKAPDTSLRVETMPVAAKETTGF